MLKLKMMLCVMMLPLVVVGYIKVSCRQQQATIARDNAAPPTNTPLNGIISPSERG